MSETPVHSRAPIIFAVAAAVLLCLVSAHVVVNDAGSKEIDSVITGTNDYGDFILAADADDLASCGISVNDLLEISVKGKTYSNGLYAPKHDIIGAFQPFIYSDSRGEVTMGIEFLDPGWSVGDDVRIKVIGKSDVYRIITKSSGKCTPSSECSSDEEIANFRMVTLGNIADGRLYRSSTLIYDERNGRGDCQVADSLARAAGVGYVFSMNLGSSIVRERYVAGELDGTYFGNLYGSDRVLADGFLITLFSDSRYGDVFRTIAEEDTSYLVNCTMGKDRTGYIIATLGALAGATYEEITDDFILSFCNYYGIEADSAEGRKMIEIRLDSLLIGIHNLELLSDYEKIPWTTEDVRSYDLKADAVHLLKTQYGLDDAQIDSLIDHLTSPLQS